MFPSIDTKDPKAVAEAVRAVQRRLYPDADPALINRLFADVLGMFAGEYMDYQPIDLRYHDLQHTLQATLCLIDLMEGRHLAGEPAVWSARHFELAVAAVLLHDTGYLKLKADTEGTGAKYTYTHVLRSCGVAATYLPLQGFAMEEMDIVLGAIRCTGPTANIRRLYFHSEAERLIGCCVATADYLGQMAAEDYPDELPLLFAEFAESDDYLKLPAEKRVFHSVEDMIAKTPAFWRKIVLPKLQGDFDAVYRYLSTPPPNGPNPYIDAVERNLERIKAMAE